MYENGNGYHMKKIYVVKYNNQEADVYDEDQGPPSWPYVDAFEAEQHIAELEKELSTLKELARPVCEWFLKSKEYFPVEFSSESPVLSIIGVLGQDPYIVVTGKELEALCREVLK